jgi:hypothetical protein
VNPERPPRSLLPDVIPRWQRFPGLPLVLTTLFLGFLFLPRVRANPALTWSFVAVGAGLYAWTLGLWAVTRRKGRVLRIELTPPLPSHYIQASVQLCIYAYWGWYWRPVYAEAPLILAQLVFLYAFDALLTWSRGRPWRLGFGPLPIILSTNVFLWFKDDWFIYQFLLIATGALGKEFIKWNREGKVRHIFNPSAFTLAVFSVFLIVTGTTDNTYARDIAITVSYPPHIYLEIFLLGLIVQYFFKVTLVTLSAVAVLALVSLVFYWTTGTYYFIDANVPVPMFIGLHFLVTDPSTSPRSNAGKMLFGALYGGLTAAFFWTFEQIGVPSVYDKLLPIPILNLLVPALERVSRVGILERFNRWGAWLGAHRLNLVHMGCWTALFLVMISTGWIESKHEGRSVEFWHKAQAEGRPMARRGLLTILKFQADRGNGEAWNELGLIYMKGDLLNRNVAKAKQCFANACRLGSPVGCINVAKQSLLFGDPHTEENLTLAIESLERDCERGANPESFYLLGIAYEKGLGRTKDKGIARILYDQACQRGELNACKALIRLQATAAEDLPIPLPAPTTPTTPATEPPPATPDPDAAPK